MSWGDEVMNQYATCASYTDRGTIYFREQVMGRLTSDALAAFAQSPECAAQFYTLVSYDAVTIIPAR